MKASWFHGMARSVARFTGTALCFGLALASVIVWGLTGPFFHYSDLWQLVINTATTIVTFLMVFLIQNAQNRDTEAIQIKLDELIRATNGAHNVLLALEEMDPEQIARFRQSYARHASRASDPEDAAVSRVGVEEIRLDGALADPRAADAKATVATG